MNSSTEMKRNEPVFIGVDGGGTHSFAIAVDSTGRLLATAEAGSLNFFGASLPVARRHLKSLRGSLERQLPRKTSFQSPSASSGGIDTARSPFA